MASSITTQADILTHVVIPDNELARLETERMVSDNWLSIHEKAWTLIKGMLLIRRPPLEESELGDSSEYDATVCFAVIYLAYQEAQIMTDEDQARKSYWYKKMRKAYAMVNPTDANGNEYGRESFGSRRALRG